MRRISAHLLCRHHPVDWILCYFSTMDANSRHQVIKRLQTELPRGAPFDLATLATLATLAPLGVTPQLAARYATSGWLVRLAQGVYAFPNDTFGVHGALLFLQKHIPGLHVGGKSALALQGVRHNLSSRDTLELWGDAAGVVPRPISGTLRPPPPVRLAGYHPGRQDTAHTARPPRRTPCGRSCARRAGAVVRSRCPAARRRTAQHLR